MYLDALDEDHAGTDVRRCVGELKQALLAADHDLNSDRALRIARELCSAGWHCPDAGDACGPGIPASSLALETRFLLRSPVLEESGDYSHEETLELVSRFSREGALILDLWIGDDQVCVEFLTTVEQAMFAVAPMRAPARSLALWLRSAGYTGNIKARLRELAGALEEKHIDPGGMDGPIVLCPLLQSGPVSWN